MDEKATALYFFRKLVYVLYLEIGSLQPRIHPELAAKAYLKTAFFEREKEKQAAALYRLTENDLVETENSACAHNTTLRAALSIGRFSGLPLPRQVEIWGIEPLDLATFGEELTESVAQAVPYVVESILSALDGSLL